MSSIDQRIVQMKFDNKEFEAGVQKSLKSLENLQKGLDLKGATNGIKNIEKAVNSFDVSGMGRSVESIANHFTWLGRTIDNTLDMITNRIISVGEQMIKSLSVDQVTVGWEKYEDKTRSVATIMNATGKSVDQVNESLQKLNWFTDETSYNFTDMVNNVGKFTSVGVDLDDAVTAMEGIANAAALAGGGVGEASRAMYNFSQAMGTGKLLLQDWKSIELANMATIDFKNTLIESGLAMGTLVKQGDAYVTTTKDGTGAIASFKDANEGFRDSLSAGWITTEVMMDTFKKYGEYADEIYKITEREGITAAEAMEKFSDESMKLGERAFKAAQEARTFTDAINATKDAVSTGWMQSFEIIFGNYEQAKQMWTDLANTLWDVFAGGAEARNDMLRETFQEAKNIISTEDWDKIANDIPFVDTFRKAILDTAKDHGIALSNMYTDEAAFLTLLEKGEITTDLLNEALNRTYESGTTASAGIADTSSKLAELESIAKKVIRGDFGNGDKRVKALTEAGYDYREVQDAVNKVLKGQSLTIENLTDAELKQIGYTDEEIQQLKQLKEVAEKTGTPLNELINTMNRPTGHELMIESASNAFEALMKVIQAVKDAWQDVFPPMTADRLYEIIEKVRDFTASLIMSDDHADKLKRVFRGVFSVFDLGVQALSAVGKLFGGLLEYLKPLGEWLLTTGAEIGDFFYRLSSNFRKFNVFGHVTDGVLKVLRTFSTKIKVIISTIFDRLGGDSLFNPIKDKWEEFKDWIISNGGIVGIIDTFFNSINGWIQKINAVKVGNAIVDFFIDIKNAFRNIGNFKEIIKKAFDKITNFFSSFGSGFTVIIEKTFNFIKEAFSKGLDVFSKAINAIFDFVEERVPNLIDILKSLLALKLLLNINKFVTIFGKLFKGITGIVEKVGKVLLQLGKGIARWTKAKLRQANAELIFKIAAAIGILVASLWVLSKMDPNKIYDSLTVLGVLGAGLLLFYNSIKDVGEKGVVKVSGFAGLAVGIFVLVKTMQSLSKMDLESVAKSLVEVGAILYILSKFTNYTNIGFKASNGFALVETALSLQLFVLAMLELAKMKPETAIEGLTGLGALLTELAIFTRLFSTGSSSFGGLFSNKGFGIGNGAGLLVTAISLQGFVLAMLEIAKMKPETAIEGLIGLGALLTEVGIFTRLASKEIKFSNGVSLLAIGTSMLIFGKSLEQLGSLDFATITKGLIGMGGLLFEVSKLTNSMSKMSIKSGIGSGIGIASLIILIPIFKQLSQIPDIEKIGISFGIGVGGIGKGIEALSHVKAGAGLAASMLEVAAIIGIIITIVEGIAGIVYKLGGDKAVSFLEGAKTILTLVGDGIGGLVGGLLGGAIGGIGVGVANSIASIGQSLTDFWNNASPFINGVKTIKAEDMGGIAELSKAVLLLGAAEFLDALTALVGGGEKNMKAFGLQLESLGPSLSTFAESVAGVTGDSVKGAAEALGILAGIDVPKKGGFIQKLVGEKDYSGFGWQLRTLGGNLAEFATKVSGIPDEGYASMTKSADVLADLLALDIPKVGGFMDIIVGRSDWGEFGSQLEAFGPGFRSFADKMNGVETNGLPAAAEALGELLKIDPPKTNWGIIQVFTGTTDWGVFGSQLYKFGVGLFNFATSIKNLTPENFSVVDSAVDAMNKILSLDLKETGGFIQWLVGEENLGDFGTNLGLLGTGFNTFYTNIGKVNIPDLTAIVGLLERLNAFANNISGSVIDNIQNFSLAITLLDGSNIDFTNAINAINDWETDFAKSGSDLALACVDTISEIISNATTPNESIKKILNSLSTTIGTFNNTFRTRGVTLINNLINGMKSIVTDVTNAALMLGNSANKELKNFDSIFYETGSYILVQFIEGMESENFRVKRTSQNLVDTAYDTFLYMENSFYNVGSILLSYFIEGMKSENYRVTDAVYMLGNNGRTGFEWQYNSFYNAGSYLLSGFVNGMNSYAWSVRNTAIYLANLANSAFNNALQIASPSKLTFKSGEYFDEGFIGGLQNRSRDVKNASEDVAYSALNSLKVAMKLVESVANDTLDFQPTIRPVVDVSGVQNGASQISSIFSQSQTIGLGGYQNPFIPRILSQIGSNMGYGESGMLYVDNTDVIQAIQDLGNEFETIKDAIAQMRVMMDSDALVGQIINKVDTELGRISNLKKRRI